MNTSIYMALKRCELYDAINDVLHDFGSKKGMPKEDVTEFSEAIIKLLSEVFGGQNFTFPKDMSYDIKIRDVAIYQEFSGSKNVAALAKKYGLSERGIRKCAARGKEYLKNKPKIDASIYKEHKAGLKTLKEIASKYRVSQVYVTGAIREQGRIEKDKAE
ncbi:Mor transcription activator family protein [Klebsiella michiganensis]|uniref:Mor transcription activator family protein n=1 Tax=Klebsiella michiganensis TaxID=1134687 RepID=UPI00068FDCAC|nr:Mor transcription activator family protein [Klebsiella michiganensis]